MAISIGHLAITVQDMDKALDFYVNGDVAPGGRFNFLYSE